MRIGIAALLLLSMALLGNSAHATDAIFAHPKDAAALRPLLSAPARELMRAQTLRGRFAQKKFLRELPMPLPSDGDFLFARDLGIAWHTRTPLDSEFILTRKGMMQKDGGNVAMRLSTDQQPALQIALRLFLALFSLDLDTLASDFQLYGTKTGEKWQLGLKPKNAAMSAAFSEAVIEGAAAVERIEMRDRNGDRTEITILQLQSGGAVTAEDRRRFAE